MRRPTLLAAVTLVLAVVAGGQAWAASKTTARRPVKKTTTTLKWPCPESPRYPAQRGDVASRFDIDGDGRQDIMVLNLKFSPALRLALADGRELAVPDSQWFEPFSVPFAGKSLASADRALLPGVFSFGTTRRVGTGLFTETTSAFGVYDCVAATLMYGDRSLVLREWAPASFGTFKRRVALRCFTSGDAHVEVVEQYTLQAAPPEQGFVAVTEAQRVRYRAGRLEKEGEKRVEKTPQPVNQLGPLGGEACLTPVAA